MNTHTSCRGHKSPGSTRAHNYEVVVDLNGVRETLRNQESLSVIGIIKKVMTESDVFSRSTVHLFLHPR